MKKLWILFVFSNLFFCINTTQFFAQSTKEISSENIVVELYLFDEYVTGNDGKARPTHILEVSDQTQEFKQPLGGGFATVGCSYCPLSAEYEFFIPKVEKINEDETRIYFRVSFKNKSKCDVDSTITIKRNKKSEFKLKCDVKAKIVVRYIERKTSDNEQQAIDN